MYVMIYLFIGVIIGRDRQYYYRPPVQDTLEVDYVGHSWVLQSRWISQYVWSAGYSPVGRLYHPTWEAAEDVSISALCWLGGRIRTIIPPMPDSFYPVWGDSISAHHSDSQATYVKPIAGKIRWPVVRYWVEHGYVPAAIRNQLLYDDTYDEDNSSVCNNMGKYCKVSN